MAENKDDKDNEDKKVSLAELVDKYSPHDNNLLETFEERFPDVNYRASSMSKFKKAVIKTHPEILAIRNAKFHTKGKEYKEYKEFEALKPQDKYNEWLKADHVEKPTLWQEFLSSFSILPKNLEDLKLRPYEATARKKEAAKRQAELHSKIPTINGNEMIQKLNVLEKHGWPLVCGLLLATGRRTSEILGEQSNFEVIGEYELEMTGKLKKSLFNDASVKFPTLAPARFLLTKIEVARAFAKVDGMTPEGINIKTSTNLSRYCHKLFNTRPHGLRGIYAALANQLYNKNHSSPQFIANILGHEKLETAVYYMKIIVTNYNGQTYAPVQTPGETKEEAKEIKDEKHDTKDEKHTQPAPQVEAKHVVVPVSAASVAAEAKNRVAMMTLIKEHKKITQTSIKAMRQGGDVAAIKAFIKKNIAVIEAHNQSLGK